MISMIVLWPARQVCDEMHNRPRKFRCRPALFHLFRGDDGKQHVRHFPGSKCSVLLSPKISGGRS